MTDLSPIPGAPPVYSVIGDRYTFLLTGAQTGGAFAVFEMFIPSGNGTPPHVHHREEEAFHVVVGEFEFVVDGKIIRVGPGEFLFAHRDIPHQFRNVGTSAGTMIVTTTPAGLDDFFAEVGERLPGRDADPIPPTPEDFARLMEAAPRYGMEVIPPH